MDLNIFLSNTASAVAVAGGLGTLFYKLTLNPLNNEIERMRRILDRIEMRLDKIDEKVDGMDVRVAKVEESAKSAHKRLDGLEQGIRKRR
jgi:peptidoglycan hydrolase CwlO-like protein